MNNIRYYLALLLCLYFSAGYAQGKKYDVSTPVDLHETGVNKVLCMKNGNTMLIHFEPAKDVVVKVFDSLHREIASQKHTCRVLDIHKIEDAVFKGLFEINGEAVLFVEQERLSKHNLVRLCFNATDGNLIDEKQIGESKSIAKPTNFYVIGNKDDDSYAILFCQDIPQFQDCKIYVAYYNNKHENIKQVPIDVDRKKYDYLEVNDAESHPNGICISLGLAKLMENGTAHGRLSAAPVYDHHLAIYYIPKGSSTALQAGAHLSNDTYPFYSNYTYNPFAKTINLLLLSYQEVEYQYGLEWLPGTIIQHLLFKIDESNMAVGYKWIKNKMASNALKQKKDTTAYTDVLSTNPYALLNMFAFEGLPINMYTNENGLSTIISESFSMYGEKETQVRYNRYTYLGYLGITQFDDDGNEIWGTVLPIKQRFKSYRRYHSPYQLSKKWQSQEFFGDLPEAVNERQFFSVNSYNYDKNFYIIFNDNNKNFNNSIEHPGDTVCNFNFTNTCYYKMNRKKEISKHYLFGEPEANEYKSSFIEGADFDEKRGIYASLVQYKKEDKTSLCMAWSKLD